MQFIEANSSLASQVMGFKPQGVVRELGRRINEYVSTTGNSGFAQELVSKFSDVTQGATYRAAQAVKSRFNRVFKTYDGIQYLGTVDCVQQAPHKMVSLIMANPKLKALAREDRVEAYGVRYDRRYLDCDTHFDPNYRKVTNGVSIKEDDNIVIRNYMEHSSVERLTTLEKLNVVSVWNRVSDWIDEGIDVTSEDNNGIS